MRWRATRDAGLEGLKAQLGARQERIAQLEAQLDARRERIAQLEAQVGALKQREAQLEQDKAALSARVEQLEALLAQSQPGRHSSNSHRPPSMDGPGAPKRPAKAPTGRKAGGQPGHAAHERPLLAAEQVVEFKPVQPESCSRCGGHLQGQQEGPEPVRHQVVEVEPIRPHVTEWRLDWGWCAHCQLWTRAQLPPGAPPGAFGPRLTALVGVMTGQLRLSKRQAQLWLTTVLGVDLSLGSLSKLEAQVSTALQAPMEQVRSRISSAPVVHADETSWRERAHRAWLWVAVTAQFTLFLLSGHRDRPAAQDLLGDSFRGILVTDRYGAYQWVEPSRRQVCWAHLKRDFQGWVDTGGVGAVWGKALLEQTRQLFLLYHRVRAGTLQRTTFQHRMALLRAEVSYLLRRAEACENPTVSGQAHAMLQLEPALWTFVSVEGVEPTNNRAERALRHAVLWRKTSGGTQSARGSCFVERILTVVATLRQQGRDVLEFLTGAVRAHLLGHPPPSLLPEPV